MRSLRRAPRVEQEHETQVQAEDPAPALAAQTVDGETFVATRASGHTLIRWFRDTNVRPKILISVGVTATFAVIVGLLGIHAMGTSVARAEGLYRDNVGGVTHVGQMRDAVAGMRIEARNVALALQEGDKAKAVSQ